LGEEFAILGEMMVVCSGTVGGTLLMSLQNVQTDVLPPVHGHADYTKIVCVLKHDINLFIQSECQLCWI
jgi:ATP-dependent protease HslVU (ClpYQ) ATPase subunit